MMVTRTFRKGWAALAVAMLLSSGASLTVRADEYEDCPEESSWSEGWHRLKDKCRWHGHSGCRRCRGMCHGRYRGPYGAVNPGYYDPRDTKLYAAKSYGVPIGVPLAPVVKHTYEYGWGVPSSRLVRVGAQYNQWYPTTPYSQHGGGLPSVYPSAYYPTDTTQQGFYHVHAPAWGRYGAW
ncbi:MAG: hypothetical protein ACKV0T_23475 [Planctomycetales bacterium]